MTLDKASRFTRPVYLPKPDMRRLWFKKKVVLRRIDDRDRRPGSVTIRLRKGELWAVGMSIHRANLARGGRQLVVIPDASRVAIDAEAWSRLGQEIDFVHLDLPTNEFTYHYRLVATVALAEIARQVGRRPPGDRRVRRRPPNRAS